MNKKDLTIMLVIVAVIGALLFYKQILAVFNGMGPLEAMQTIWTFVLHVAVTTALMWAAYTIPEIVKPFLKMLKHKQKFLRRGRTQAQPTEPKVRMPRGNKEQAMLWMLSQMAKSNQPTARRSTPVQSQDEERPIRLDF